MAMTYKGYVSAVEFDDEAGIFHGEVINTRDVITFQGDCVDGLRKAFEESIDEYLKFCSEIGKSPEKPFSGRLPLRLTPELHQKIFIKASQQGKSINRFITETLEKQVSTE
jgi:predicted HicB family RNase H-like nuclease